MHSARLAKEMSLVHGLVTSRLGNSVTACILYRNNVVHQISHELVYRKVSLLLYNVNMYYIIIIQYKILIVQGSPLCYYQSTRSYLCLGAHVQARYTVVCVCVYLGCYTELLRDQ